MREFLLKGLCALQADRRGVTVLEYALIAALIAGVVVGVFSTLGQDIQTSIGNTASAVFGPAG
jgi:Flp pilus assembly pilin Flp